MTGEEQGLGISCTDVIEQALVQRLQAGDAEAFDTLFRRYFAKVYRQATHLVGTAGEAEEVVQEVFLAVYEKSHTFRGESAFATWLYRLTVNAALSRLRRRQRRPEIAMDDYLPQFREDGHHLVRPVVDWSSDLEQGLANAQMQQLLRQAIELLPPLDKAVLVLSDSARGFGGVRVRVICQFSPKSHQVRILPKLVRARSNRASSGKFKSSRRPNEEN